MGRPGGLLRSTLNDQERKFANDDFDITAEYVVWLELIGSNLLARDTDQVLQRRSLVTWQAMAVAFWLKCARGFCGQPASDCDGGISGMNLAPGLLVSLRVHQIQQSAE